MRERDVSADVEIQRALIKDRDAGFTMLVHTFQPGIYSGVRRMTNGHADAEEIAQDTFLRAYRALAGYEKERIRTLQLRAWLWTIALNLCRNRASRSAPESPKPSITAESTHDEIPLDAAAWNRRLDRLSPHQRAAVVLRHIVDLPIADIAAISGRPEGTVKADISRGLNRLRDSMEAEAVR